MDQIIDALLKRDRMVVLVALLGVVFLSWAYILSGAGMGMSAFEMTRLFPAQVGMKMMMPVEWDAHYAALMFVMWWLMMVAMMLTSAAPMVLLFAAMNRKRKNCDSPYVPTFYFASAYLLTWAGFSIAAVFLQWQLQRSGLLTPMLESGHSVLGASLLFAAGIYQLSPLKQACLTHCRSPLQFMMARWRKGIGGAFTMGLEHGAYCVGCCWFLMGLLFFGGVMNLYWIIGLTALVLLEKFHSTGPVLSRVVGIGLLAGAIWVLFARA